MAKVEPHGIFAEDDDGKQTDQIGWITPADKSDVKKLLAKPKEPDGRSGHFWLRFRDGTLMLGVFPTGDTYMEFSDAGVCDWEDAEPNIDKT